MVLLLAGCAIVVIAVVLLIASISIALAHARSNDTSAQLSRQLPHLTPEQEAERAQAAAERRLRERTTEAPPIADWGGQEWSWGSHNRAMVCSHCQKAGAVYTKRVKAKAGISGGKATAALLTGGLSLLVIGLSRRESRTQAHCVRCDSNWQF